MTSDSGVDFLEYDAGVIQDYFGDGVSADYLQNYLADLAVTSVLVEHRYVDRHYLDEFANFYSRSFQVPPAHCKRLHFFRTVDSGDLLHCFREATASPSTRYAATQRLEEAYLGFIVRRPLPSASVGRTVLRTYPCAGRRHFDAGRNYQIHLAGLTLSVHGLAFQHQDGGAAVCASTALWCALQGVAVSAGQRTPTPFAITSAAESPFPASVGLTELGMATALSRLGYLADSFAPANNRDWFRALVLACLESHLPVVLLLVKKRKIPGGEVEEGHAITLTGFSEPSKIVLVSPSKEEDVQPFAMAAGSLDIVYSHDDNLGPHAHYELVDSDEVNDAGHKILSLKRGDSDNPRPSSWTPDLWRVEQALVPKPEKLRLPISGLLRGLGYYAPVLDAVFEPMRLNFRGRFDTGVGVKESLLDEPGYDQGTREELLFNTELPRHVGILTAFMGEDRLCDVVLDVTDNYTRPLAILAPGVLLNSTPGVRLAHLTSESGAQLVHGQP